jgi:uncharacterized protein YgiM (DUF1202 family)
MPYLSGTPIGLLTENVVVQILEQHGNWFEIKFNGRSGFVYSNYVASIETLLPIKGRTTATRLNVRDRPGFDGAKIGSLAKGAVIDILEKHGDWLEIGFNEQSAFVHEEYVEFVDAGSPKQGTVSADVLNVRRAPRGSGEIIGSLSYDTEVNILSRVGRWYEIRFNESTAFVHGDFIRITGEAVHKGALVITPGDIQDRDMDADDLAPQTKLPVTGSNIEKKVAKTWNNFGGILTSLSGAFQIDPGSAIAVLCVESSGRGFSHSNQNRMIIRFENHLFWKYWGKKNSEIFHRHLQYGKREDGRLKVWLGHVWRENLEEAWQPFHGSQAKEWQVLEFGRSLDDTAALLSISMGAPQIMGFNHRKIGYETVQEMFNKFSRDIRYQISGLFDFFDDAMIEALQKRDFVTFAGHYNGPGQKHKYGQWIQNYYDAFREVTV